MDTVEIAKNFVNLVLKHADWKEVKELPADEVQVFFDTVSAAGLKPKQVVIGKLLSNYRDMDGPTKETYPINHLCPYKVIGQDGKDDYFATGWLDCALRFVFGNSKPTYGNKDEVVVFVGLVKALNAEIERSIPLQPIQITADGDILEERHPTTRTFGFEFFVDHTRDDSLLESWCGVHKYCGRQIDRVCATETKDAILCRGCYLRVLFSKEIKTYGALRQEIAKRIYDSLPEGGVLR
ncbi:MAG: hypothetical protein WAV11_01880 [Minisyncoccia bacterium]